jgi:hypothetical protein
MKIRTFLLSAASTAAFFPYVSHASPENTALNACARAFAASIAPAGSSAPAFKLKYRNSQPGSAIDEYYGGREYTFYLQAHDSKTGATVASASCTADTRGAHLALTATPLDGQEATLAARL